MVRRRDKTRERRARATQASQRNAAATRVSRSKLRRRRALAWTLIAFGTGIALQHLIHHLGAFTLISNGWDDLVAGYPLAALLGIIGAILLSAPYRLASANRKRPPS